MHFGVVRYLKEMMHSFIFIITANSLMDELIEIEEVYYLFQTNLNTRKFVILPIGLNIELVQLNLNLNILIHFFVHILSMHLLILIIEHY